MVPRTLSTAGTSILKPGGVRSARNLLPIWVLAIRHLPMWGRCAVADQVGGDLESSRLLLGRTLLQIRVVVQHFKIQLIRPPICVFRAFGLSSAKDTSAEGATAEWAFAFAHNRLRCSYSYGLRTGFRILLLTNVLGDFPLCRSLFTGVVFRCSWSGLLQRDSPNSAPSR